MRLRYSGDPGCVPRRYHHNDAGFDLFVSQDMWIDRNEFKDVPMGGSVELPPEMWGLLCARSSTLRKRGLLIVQGIIDNGYRGPLFAQCQNMRSESVELRRGERIAQLVLLPLAPTVLVEQAIELSASARGSNGWGSTGT